MELALLLNMLGLASRWYETKECTAVAKELTSIGIEMIRKNLMELAVYILAIRLRQCADSLVVLVLYQGTIHKLNIK